MTVKTQSYLYGPGTDEILYLIVRLCPYRHVDVFVSLGEKSWVCTQWSGWKYEHQKIRLEHPTSSEAPVWNELPWEVHMPDTFLILFLCTRSKGLWHYQKTNTAFQFTATHHVTLKSSPPHDKVGLKYNRQGTFNAALKSHSWFNGASLHTLSLLRLNFWQRVRLCVQESGHCYNLTAGSLYEFIHTHMKYPSDSTTSIYLSITSIVSSYFTFHCVCMYSWPACSLLHSLASKKFDVFFNWGPDRN